MARVSGKSDAWLELIFGDPLPLRRGHQHGRDGGGPRGSTNSRRGCDEHINFGVKGARQRRIDFVAYLYDVKNILLHPGRDGETETWPIEGDLLLWAIVDEGSAAPLAAAGRPGASQEYPYRRLTDQEGWDLCLQECVQTWEDAFATDDGHFRRFTVNLTGARSLLGTCSRHAMLSRGN